MSYPRQPHLVVVVVTMALTTTVGTGFVLVAGRMAHREKLGRLLTLLRRILLNGVTTTRTALKLLGSLEPRSILVQRSILALRSIREQSCTLDPLLLLALASRGKLAFVSSFRLLTRGADPVAPLQLLLELWASTGNLGVVAIGVILKDSAKDTLVDPEDGDTHGEG
jgi:hypothetical protein